MKIVKRVKKIWKSLTVRSNGSKSVKEELKERY